MLSRLEVRRTSSPKEHVSDPEPLVARQPTSRLEVRRDSEARDPSPGGKMSGSLMGGGAGLRHASPADSKLDRALDGPLDRFLDHVCGEA